VLSVNVFLRIPQQNVHVGIDALEGTLVLGLAPLQADEDLSADSAMKINVSNLTGGRWGAR
jgi:hypothetical protein